SRVTCTPGESHQHDCFLSDLLPWRHALCRIARVLPCRETTHEIQRVLPAMRNENARRDDRAKTALALHDNRLLRRHVRQFLAEVSQWDMDAARNVTPGVLVRATH